MHFRVRATGTPELLTTNGFPHELTDVHCGMTGNLLP
jgi:hypothetical protein